MRNQENFCSFRGRLTLDWVEGDDTGLLIPAHGQALAEGGPAFLTAALRTAGTLSPDNEVARITNIADCPGGSTGTKLFLSVNYKSPGAKLPEDLFVKFSRDFSDPIRDRNRDQLAPEVRLALLSRHENFPITVPACMFGDYQQASGTGVLITERIRFGAAGIEPHRDKCLDYELPDAPAHYACVITANARLAAAHKSGRLGAAPAALFPYDAGAEAARDPIRFEPRQLRNRISRLGAFAAEFPRLFPAFVMAPDFLAKLAAEMQEFLAREAAIKRFLTADPALIALCHWNANIDNAWFRRDARGALQCGLMDWGRVGQMNMALALWGTLSAAEPDMLDAELDPLLTLFLDELSAHGGPQIPLALLRDHLFLYVAAMGMAWLLDAPPMIRAAIPDLAPEHDRFDERFKRSETARAQLTMLTNVLNLWYRHDFAQSLSRRAPD